MTDRFAIIADIHGNADALTAVLADIDAHGVDMIVNLGDHLSGPLAAAETLAILRSRPMVNLRGNHDRWLVEQAPDEMSASDRAAYGELTPDDLAWLRALPTACVLDAEIFACHAAPGDDLTYWLQKVAPDGSVADRPLAEVEALAAPQGQCLMVCGHTHLAGERRLSDGRRVLNPGSVGLPAYDDDAPVFHVMEAGSPEARYALLSRVQDGDWDVTWRSLAYDPSRMAGIARGRGRTDWAHALETGRLPA